ncbi:Sua5/YciO/YrdC/YwlC family protein [Candidatus Kaiserbacteria bacterium]|nr:Sua5/YciO/YrdC/YwlC family protein [Candidatus Kaiserbacteria bacterium]
MDPYKTTDAMVKLLLEGGKAIVSPTKVGYIVMTTDRGGLERKFEMKGRPRSKPGVVLCSNVKQVLALAQVNAKVEELYRRCRDKDILLGCILPWKEDAAEQFIPNDGSIDMVQDGRKTSCFVIKFGRPSEEIAFSLWHKYRKLCFASSANPSGQGNRGKLEFVGERIIQSADQLVFADDYVARQQPGKDMGTRWEQGVMVSMVDGEGRLLQDEAPTIIRHGLALDHIRHELTQVFNFYQDKHGSYH